MYAEQIFWIQKSVIIPSVFAAMNITIMPLTYIKEKIENPFFIFFSDDIAYVKENMDTEN